MKLPEVGLPSSGGIENCFFVNSITTHVRGIIKVLWYIFYLLGFLTQNDSALFDLFILSDPCFVNSYLIPWLT